MSVKGSLVRRPRSQIFRVMEEGMIFKMRGWKEVMVLLFNDERTNFSLVKRGEEHFMLMVGLVKKRKKISGKREVTDEERVLVAEAILREIYGEKNTFFDSVPEADREELRTVLFCTLMEKYLFKISFADPLGPLMFKMQAWIEEIADNDNIKAKDKGARIKLLMKISKGEFMKVLDPPPASEEPPPATPPTPPPTTTPPASEASEEVDQLNNGLKSLSLT